MMKPNPIFVHLCIWCFEGQYYRFHLSFGTFIFVLILQEFLASGDKVSLGLIMVRCLAIQLSSASLSVSVTLFGPVGKYKNKTNPRYTTVMPLVLFSMETPKRVIGKQHSTDPDQTPQIRVTADCKKFSHFSLEISISHTFSRYT